MEIYQINISGPNDKGPNENFFFQQFCDYRNHKVREIVRIINEFPPEKSFEFKKPKNMTVEELEELTTFAQNRAKHSGASLNFELVKHINAWVRENL